MNNLVYEKLMNSNFRVTRRVSYIDFNVEQLKNIRALYIKKGVLNVAETAILLGVCYQTVYRLINKGKIVLINDGVRKKPFLIDVKKTLKNFDITF